MAYYRIEYFSQALCRPTAFEVLLPNDPRPESPYINNKYQKLPMGVLFLLHGYTGKAELWAPAELAEKYHFAIVMPSAENSFYLNGPATGHAFETLVGVEMVDYVRKTFHVVEDNSRTCIAGLSMGGFGALHTGLAYPETFGKIGALSSALIVHEVGHMKPGEGNPVANYDYYRGCFGDTEHVIESRNNPEVLVQELKKAGKKLPGIYMCCGTEDFLIENNREFHQFLEKEEVPHIYKEDPGIHDMVFWSSHIPDILRWMYDEGDD